MFKFMYLALNLMVLMTSLTAKAGVCENEYQKQDVIDGIKTDPMIRGVLREATQAGAKCDVELISTEELPSDSVAFKAVVRCSRKGTEYVAIRAEGEAFGAFIHSAVFTVRRTP